MLPVKSEEYELMKAYSEISSRYSKLKTKPWKDFQAYLSSLEEKIVLPKSGILLDVGSGNGRNLILFQKEDYNLIASDLSFSLLSSLVPLPAQKTQIVNNDMRLQPFKKNSTDFVLLIASIHHLRKKKDMIKALDEIGLILKNEGYLIMSCWRRWKRSTRTKMIMDLLLFPFKKIANYRWQHGDILLPWYDEKKKVVARRYYHLFTKRELMKLLNKTNFVISDFSCMGGQSRRDNFFVLLRRKAI